MSTFMSGAVSIFSCDRFVALMSFNIFTVTICLVLQLCGISRAHCSKVSGFWCNHTDLASWCCPGAWASAVAVTEVSLAVAVWSRLCWIGAPLLSCSCALDPRPVWLLCSEKLRRMVLLFPKPREIM